MTAQRIELLNYSSHLTNGSSTELTDFSPKLIFHANHNYGNHLHTHVQMHSSIALVDAQSQATCKNHNIWCTVCVCVCVFGVCVVYVCVVCVLCVWCVCFVCVCRVCVCCVLWTMAPTLPRPVPRGLFVCVQATCNTHSSVQHTHAQHSTSPAQEQVVLCVVYLVTLVPIRVALL